MGVSVVYVRIAQSPEMRRVWMDELKGRSNVGQHF